MTENQNYKHIVRVVNVDIPGDKPIRFALTKIKGVGINLADVACTLTKVDKQQKTGTLSDSDIQKLNDFFKNLTKTNVPKWMYNRQRDYDTGEDKHILTSDLSFTKENDLKRLKKMKCLRGARHQKGLPVRGQKTRSNFRRNKGKVVGVKRKKK